MGHDQINYQGTAQLLQAARKAVEDLDDCWGTCDIPKVSTVADSLHDLHSALTAMRRRHCPWQEEARDDVESQAALKAVRQPLRPLSSEKHVKL